MQAEFLSSRSSVASQAAVSLAQQQKEDLPEGLDDTEIFQKACDLSDMGFGDFDVCLTVLTAKKGNVK